MRIDNRTNYSLSQSEKKVFREMFAGYQQVVIKTKFESGFSPSLVFLARPIRQAGVPELPCVVKLDDHERIAQEWEAYQACIKNRLPGVAEIDGEPVYPRGARLGGLRYPLVGDGAFNVQSFYDFYREKDTAVICDILENRLCKRLDALWRHKTTQAEFHFHASYDSFLPPNLVIDGAAKLSSPGVWLHPESVRGQSPGRGDAVQAAGFQVVKVDREREALWLDIPDERAGAYRIRVTAVSAVNDYEVGQIIQKPLAGRVTETRAGKLRGLAAAALGPSLDLTADSFPIANRFTLPNPLKALPQLLNYSQDVNRACIHADLNLRNVLVEPDSGHAYLIDFIHARPDHVLRDLLHLEMAIVTELLPLALEEGMQAVTAVIPFYQQLHRAVSGSEGIRPPAGLEKPFTVLATIRRMVGRYLFEPDQWTEYFHGLIIYLLGALRFGSLDEIPGAKQVAFWGAATTLQLLQSPPAPIGEEADAPDDEPGGKAPGTQNDGIMITGGNVSIDAAAAGPGSRQEYHKTNFHGPVTGPVHTGSGDINVSDPSQTSQRRHRDPLSNYETGIERLLAQMGEGHPRYSDALVYQQRLEENLTRTRRFGDTPTRQADRAEIIDLLNELALTVTGTSFNALCQETE